MIDWVMKAEGVSFRHAVELLRAERLRCRLAPGRTAHGRRRRCRAPVEPDAEDRGAARARWSTTTTRR